MFAVVKSWQDAELICSEEREMSRMEEKVAELEDDITDLEEEIAHIKLPD